MAVPLLVKPLPVSETSPFRPGLRVTLDEEVRAGGQLLDFARTGKIKWRIKGEYLRLIRSMALRSCRVSITDLKGVRHTAEVTASTPYEAVALGLAVIRGNGWVADLPEDLNTVEVSVTEVHVTHAVRFRDFKNWIDRTGGSPRDVAQRRRIREILGLVGEPDSTRSRTE
jgi:hypothetical protein